MEQDERQIVHDVSLVVPVYQGERTLHELVAEVAPLTTIQTTPAGRQFRVVEMLLVHDGAIDGSAAVIRSITAAHLFAHPVWLSRNFGQHPATLAGMASTVGDWVVTMDEDGQQNPKDIGKLLDTGLENRSRLVYARPANSPPHGFIRNMLSAIVKWVFVHGMRTNIGAFNSFRLMEGQVARGVAAYCGANVYLDVALSWVVGLSAHCPVQLRLERGRRSGYTPGRLLRHFWQLILTSGTLPLRMISLLGAFAVVLAIGISVFAAWQRLQHQIPVQGWTTLIIIICLFAGATLVALGVIAEYLGFAVSMGMGRPAYLIVSRPREELGRKS
jgi:glycosyltransferase involved in cell wall biosynthesis